MRALAAACGLVLVVAPLQARADEDDARVQITGGSEIVLERIIAGTDLWESVCVGTCDSRIPLEGKYRVTGRGVRPSLPLALVAGEKGVVRLDAHVKYSAGWVGGIIMTVLGPLISVGGSFAVALEPQNQTPPCFTIPCSPTTQPPPNNSFVIGGGLAIGVGITMTIAGILAIIVDDHTTVHQRVSLSPRNMTITF